MRCAAGPFFVLLAFALPAPAQDWKLVFEDDFERADLGDRYEAKHAEEAGIRDGQLFFRGRHSMVYIARPFAMDHRLEFDCMAWPELPPCDLSVYMNGTYILGFGARDNRAHHIYGGGIEVVDLDPKSLIEPGRRYRMAAQREGKRITYSVDGTQILEAVSDDLRGGPSFDRIAFMTYAGMLVDNVKVYERSEPHPDTQVYLTALPPLPIEREGRNVRATGAVSATAQAAIDALNAGDPVRARMLFESEPDLLVRLAGLAHVYGDLSYRERPAIGPNSGEPDYGELGAFAEAWASTAKARPDDATLRAFLPAVRAFGRLVLRRSGQDHAKLLVDLGPAHNPFYYKARLYLARYIFWNGMEGASEPLKNEARGILRELAALWPDHTILRQYLGPPVPWGESLNADPSRDPAWAAFLREAYAREIALLERFCDLRQVPSGEFGGGWGDDVEMMRKWVPIAAISSCTGRIRDSIARLTDGIDRYVAPDGYYPGIADVEHTAEPTADPYPTMLLLRHGDPRYYELNLKSARITREMTMGTDALGYPRFKSTLIGGRGAVGDKGLQDRLHGGGDTGYHARAMKPFLWLAWYGNAEARDYYLRWVDGWRNTAMIDAPDKPAGVVPGTIWFPSGSYNPPNGEPWWGPKGYNYYGTMGLPGMVHQSFLAAYALSGDRRFLQPFQRMMDIATAGPYTHRTAEPPSREWFFQNVIHQAGARECALYRMLTGEGVYDEYIRKGGNPAQVYPIDRALEPYLASFERAARSLRHNIDYLTTEVQSTDRLPIPAVAEVFGAYTGAITTTTDAEYPTFGVTYETPDADFAAIVTENAPERLRAMLYGFWDQPQNVGLRFWRLVPGRYRVTQGARVAGERPGQHRYTWGAPESVDVLRKGDGFTITLPPRTEWVVDVRLDTAAWEEPAGPDVAAGAPAPREGRGRKPAPTALPDLAIHERDVRLDGNAVAVTVHNIGAAAAERFAVALQEERNGLWLTRAEMTVERLAPPADFKPSTVELRLERPPRVGGPSRPDRESWRVMLDPMDAAFEISERNNVAAVIGPADRAPKGPPAVDRRTFVPSTAGKKLLHYRGPVEGRADVAFDGVIVGGPLVFRDRVDAAKLDAWAEETAKKDFGRHTDNFYLVYSVPGKTAADFDWFDDHPWIVENWRLVAAAARKARFKGICFDSEYYEGMPLFGYEMARHAKTKTFAEYEARVRQCAAEIMRAVVKEFPDVKIIQLFGFSGGFNGVPQHPVSREKLYPLVSAFVDGLLSECGPGAEVHDMHEQGFSFRIPGSYARARAMMKDLGAEHSADPARYRRHHRAGFSFWADCWENASQGRAFAVDDLERNYYTPDEFAYSIHQALAYSDEYVWMWPGVFDWWGGTARTIDENKKEVKRPIPEGYLKGLEQAHAASLPEPKRDRAPNTYRNEPAAKQEGFADEAAFGDLWETHTFVADLPEAWRFRTDPDEQGGVGGWWRPGFDVAAWEAIRIREFWENQGHSPYDGAAWYRLTWTPPATPEGKRVWLAFGGVADEAQVAVNGRLVHASIYGENIRHKRFLADVTGVLKPGAPNTIAVRVWNTGWCGGIWKNIKLVTER
jgi:hypothetical protein